MPLSSIKDLAVAISTRAGPAEDDPPMGIVRVAGQAIASLKHNNTSKIMQDT